MSSKSLWRLIPSAKKEVAFRETIKRIYYIGDVCPACNGSGSFLMPGDAHKSEGWVPCSWNKTINGKRFYCSRGKIAKQ